MNKVIARVFGGLGNQLFIYAAARRIAILNDSELILDDISGFTYDSQYRRVYELDKFNIPCRKALACERFEPFSRARRYFTRAYNAHLPFERRWYICQDGPDFDSRILGLKLNGDTYLEGYWQSEDYFCDIKSTVQEELRFCAPVGDSNISFAKALVHENSVAVHVRFFDTINVSPTNCVSIDYYQRAIAEMDMRVLDAHYYIFSDDPMRARSFIPLPNERFTLVTHNQNEGGAYSDFWLMTQCRHFIIANSTFSWWGAWLALGSEKVVIAPGLEKLDGSTNWGFRGLLPSRWVRL